MIDDLHKKIALGTVQLGLSYGINNQVGKPSQATASEILHLASQSDIRILDSAEAYGDSLSVIGNFLKDNPDAEFKLISKFIDDGSKLRPRLNATLGLLRQKKLYAYMYHRFSDFQNSGLKNQLLELKAEGKIEHIGLSLYSNTELAASLDDSDITIIQLPFNAFDSAPAKKEMLMRAKSAGKEIHVRSAFLQGLFFKEPATLSGNMTGLASSLRAFHNVLVRYSMNAREACLNYVIHHPFVDYAVIGVETRQQLEENLVSIRPAFGAQVMAELESTFQAEPLLLNPSNWRP